MRDWVSLGLRDLEVSGIPTPFYYSQLILLSTSSNWREGRGSVSIISGCRAASIWPCFRPDEAPGTSFDHIYKLHTPFSADARWLSICEHNTADFRLDGELVTKHRPQTYHPLPPFASPVPTACRPARILAAIPALYPRHFVRKRSSYDCHDYTPTISIPAIHRPGSLG